MKKALYILSELSDRDFEWLLHTGRNKRISAGTALIQQGETIDALYILLEGKLAVLVGDNQEQIAQLTQGEVVGEISFLDSRPPTATVKAVEESIVWAIPRTQLASKLLQDVAFSSHFYHALALFLSDRLRGTVSRLGYDQNQTPPNADSDEGLNPQVANNLEIAQARLDWLLSRLRETQH